MKAMLAAALIGLTACASNQGAGPPKEGPIPFDRLSVGSVPSDSDRAEVVVVRSADEARQLRVRLVASDLSLAERVEYGTRVVLAVFVGQRPTAGFVVQVTEVRVDGGGELVASATVSAPQGFAAQVISNPYALVTVDRDAVEGIDEGVVRARTD